MSTLYEVSSLIALVMNRPNAFSQVIGILNKGTKIDVISISGSYAYFKYNNTDAYVKKNNLKIVNTQPIEVKGSVILKYLEINTQNEVYASETINNLTLGTYKYDAKILYGYKIESSTSQSVTLTESSPNQTITFYYSKILGTVTINYIDENTNASIYQPTVIENLTLGTYTYGPLEIEGYYINDALTKTVTLTETNPNATISYKYKEILGSLIIKYLSNSTSTELLPSETINNLKLGKYTYTAKFISGYTISDSSTQTITLTSDKPDVEIAFVYDKLYGSVTLKYIDELSGIPLASEDKYSNLEFGNYSYTAKPISGYKLISNSTQTITINDNNLNTVITFKYSVISGSVTIKYVIKNTGDNLKDPITYSNLSLGEYSYDSIEIDGYNMISADNQSVTLSDNIPDATIVFEYEKIIIPADLNWNEVPYISTYYIKPVVEPGEDVLIDYYITDYYYKEYMEKYNLKEDKWGDDNWTEEVWNNETFTVTIRIEGKEDKLYHNLKAGDHQVSLGSFINEGEEKFSILCTDKYGRNSHELFNFFLVRKPMVWNEYVMTKEDLSKYNIKNTDNYEIKKIINLSGLSSKISATVKAALIEEANKVIPESKTYVCVIADTTGDGTPDYWWAENQVVYSSDYDKTAVLQEATNTRIGLQKLLDDKKAEGYNKLTLLKGIYRIDHQLQIYVPTDFTLDMNGATLKQNQFIGNKSLMIELNNTFDSHVINGIVEGDYFSHDYTNSTNNSEWVNGIHIGGECKYSSFENLTIKDITGYGSSNGIAYSRDGKLVYTYLSPRSVGNVFKLGDIDRNTGLDIESTNRTTSDFRDISGYETIGYLSVSIYLGYQGNPCGTWNLICHFYDSNKKFIKSIDAYQYRRISIPKTSKYMRITILSISYPTNLSIQYFRIPTNCSFINNKHENCRCVGMAPCAMSNILVENCSFTNSGQSSAKCALDAEDGWDMMQDTTFKNNTFTNNPNNNFLTCAGHNFIIDGEINGQVYMWERTRSSVIKNCKNTNISLQSGGNNTIVRHGVYRVYNNNFIGGNVSKNLSKNNTSSSALGGIIYNSIISGFVDSSIYNNCKLLISSDFICYISNIQMIKCDFQPIESFSSRYKISFNGGHLNSYYFENCNFYGKCSLSNHVNFYSGKFINCSFNDVNIFPSVLADSNDLIYFENCKINYSQNNLIYYSPFAYTKGTSTNIEFNICSITNTDNNINSLIYCYSKPNGLCKFINCNINIPETSTILDSSPSYLDNIISYNLNFTNSPLPNKIYLLGNVLKNNNNIKITIN